jgi:hypothetical protein
MYKNFNQTADGGYSLKKQGVISTIIIGGMLAALAIAAIWANMKQPQNGTALLALLILSFALLVFWRITRQFIVYPQQRLFKYSKGLGAGFREFHFDELEGATVEKMKNTGITVGSSFKLDFEQNGKYKSILLGQNISAKKQRSIMEEINQMMETIH